jgi:lipoprotein-releasing system permease protein
VKTTRLIALGGLLAFGGLVAFVYAFAASGLLPLVLGEFASLGIGFGPFLGSLGAVGSSLMLESQRNAYSLMVVPEAVETAQRVVGVGVLLWVGGWLVLARALQPDAELAFVDSPAKGKALFPRLANSRDFHWGTLAAYGFGLLLSELVFIGAYLLLVGKATGAGAVTGGLAPVYAFLWAGIASLVVAFGAGFIGAANAKRLSIPELTIAILYFGLPVPVFMTLMHHLGWLMLNIGNRLRELVYLSSLLGENRPELGYWLMTAALALFVFIGINLGFVATASGRFDLRISYESFIASRHLSVFRPRLVIGVFAVLFLGTVLPLILLAIVIAAEHAVNRTRIKRLGLVDPLRAAEALNREKLDAQTPTELMTAISVWAVGLGVMALIIVLSVMSGFEADLQKKILGTNSHGVVMKYQLEMPEYAEVMEKINQVRGITGATPFILNEVMVSSEGNISGSMIKGIDPSTVGSVTDLPSSLGCEVGKPCQAMEALEDPTKIRVRRLEPKPGAGALDERPAGGERDIIRDPLIEIEPQKADDAPAQLPGIIVGKELASSLKVLVGDRMNVVSPLGGELGPQGPMPKSRPFRVAGIFYSGMFEYDSKFVYIHLREAQSFFGIKGRDQSRRRRQRPRHHEAHLRLARWLPVPDEGLGRNEPQPLCGASTREARDGDHSDHHRDRRCRPDLCDGDHAGTREAQRNRSAQGPRCPRWRHREDLSL